MCQQTAQICPDLCSQGTFTAMELLAALRRKAIFKECKYVLVLGALDRNHRPQEAPSWMQISWTWDCRFTPRLCCGRSSTGFTKTKEMPDVRLLFLTCPRDGIG